MAEAVRVLVGGPQIAYVLAFGALCAALQIFLAYKRYVAVLKWLTLALFAYVATLFFVKIDWRALRLRPRSFRASPSGADDLTAIVAILGTTISPYLFFWQVVAGGRGHENDAAAKAPEAEAPEQAPERERADPVSIPWLGMGFSNGIALAIMATAAATLNVAGTKNVR